MISGDALKSMTGSATDAEGRYTVPNLPSGQYTLKVNYMGYEQVKQEVTLDPGQKLVVDFQLLTAAIQMETYVVTASRRRERVEDAPAAISVITKQDIRRESNTNLGDYMKTTKGIDFTQSGIDSYNMTARGFNSSFSSRLLSLTDGRMANVPSLRLTAYNVIPVSFEDVEQIEIVLGPSSALYGPNAHSGVLNIITSSPLRSTGTTINIQGGLLNQSDTDPLQKFTFRTAHKFGNVGIKVSGVALRGHDWRHFNKDEWEGHDGAFIGRIKHLHDGIDNGGLAPESGSPIFTDLMLHVWENSDPSFVGCAYKDGIKTDLGDAEPGSPVITQAMIDAAANDPIFHRYYVPGTDIILWNVTADMLGFEYADGIDNDGNGAIDDLIDEGIDDVNEHWFDGVDNDGDGNIDEDDEQGTRWLRRFGAFKLNWNDNLGGFGDYDYDENGNLIFDTNNNDIFDDNWGSDGLDNDGDGIIDNVGEGDFKINYGNFPNMEKDSNNDGINDLPDFDVRNYRYDIRGDWEPNPDFLLSLSHGYAWARNINITGIARYLADGWVYRYYQGRMRYRNFFLQTYLNTSFSGEPSHPTRNMATGGLIYDRSKKFSAQFQHAMEFFQGNFRFVWGLDYFLTLPDTRGTILSDKNLTDLRDNNGNGESGSPYLWLDSNENGYYDEGERYTDWDSETPALPGGTPLTDNDNIEGALADGIDNDNDGLIDEGIDEAEEDNRYKVNELGTYYQFNWRLNDYWELIQATRLDAHDRLTHFVEFNNQEIGSGYSPLDWKFNFDQKDGLQISPKVGLIWRPRENQNFRLTWATAFNTPSNQALFLDIFVTRVSIFKVFARGSGEEGYRYTRNAQGEALYYSTYPKITEEDNDGDGFLESYSYAPIDSTLMVFYPSVDPRIKGFFGDHHLKDLDPIKPETVKSWELGYKGRVSKRMFATLDLYTSHYSSFISGATFITPIILERDKVYEKDWDGDGIINDLDDLQYDIINDPDDYDLALDNWRQGLADGADWGVASLGNELADTLAGIVTPIVVGYVNYGEVDVWGLDASVTYFISRELSLDLTYSHLGMTEFLNPITKAIDPINAPTHKGGFKLQYAPKKWPFSLSLNGRYVNSFKWSSGIYYGNISAYTIFDLHVGYKFNEYLSGNLTINNMLDHHHTEIIGGPKLGRAIMFRLQAMF
jgi:outer membrane receptor protein involved in Fe transport